MTPSDRPRAAPVLTSAEAQYLLRRNPSAAQSRAENVLAENADSAEAQYLLGAALRRQRRISEARAVLESLVAAQPDMAAANFELGVLLGGTGEHGRAIAHFAAAVEFQPRYFDAWFALAEQLVPPSDSIDPLRAARERIKSGSRADAAAMISDLVAREPDNVAARFLNAALLLAFDRAAAAANEIGCLVERDPDDRHYRTLYASALYANEDFEEAAREYDALLKLAPDRAGIWMSYGRALRALGRKDESVAAFRKAAAILPSFGDPWRSLAAVNGFRFDAMETSRMRECLERNDILATNRTQLQYALAKAEESAGNYAEAFAHYEAGNSLQKAYNPFNANGPAGFVRRSKSLYSREFFHERAGAGFPARDPIFIVGLPRSGTTLVEQIISSHPAVEGMEELPFLGMAAARIANTREGETIDSYLDRVPALAGERFGELGEYYLGLAHARRRSTRPFFTDKMPINFVHIGLAHLLLPNARIIDVRRNPLDCCMSCFSSYFVFPQPFAHSLTDLGRYYSDYVELMDHYDRVLPGRVSRVIYDDLVGNPEKEIRRLLESLKLPFQESCLRFYENARSVRTLSAEQVRRPVYAEGVGAWLRYEPWLDPLKSALGGALKTWRGVANERSC